MESSGPDLSTRWLVLLFAPRGWEWRKNFYFDRPVRVTETDLARTVTVGLTNIVIALLVPAVTALRGHRATRFLSCLRRSNLGASFLLWRFGRGLRQGIVSAVQTPTLGSHRIAPAIVGARLTSRPVLFHIVSLSKSSTTLRAYRSNLPGYGGRSARSQTSIPRSAEDPPRSTC